MSVYKFSSISNVFFQLSELTFVCYLVNLVDHTGKPLKSHVAMNNKEKSDISEELVEKHGVRTVYHNSGFSIIE